MFTSTSINKIYKTIVLISSKRHLKTNYTTLLSNRLHFSSDSSSSNKDFYDVVIAGGGMVGCSMACKLVNDPGFHDMSILLLEGGPGKTIQKPSKGEKKTGRTYSNRVSALSKSSVKLLQSVGAWEIIENLYGYCEVKEMRIWNSSIEKSDKNNILTFGNDDNLAYMVENDAILEALHSKILNNPNITVQYDSKVDQCYLPKQDTDLAVVKIANREKTYNTSLLIGSDGFHSKVRSSINGQQYLSWEYGQRAVVANVQLQNTNSDSNDRNVAWQKFATLGPIALLPLDNQTCSIAWTTSNEEAQRLVQCTEDEFIKTLNSALSDEESNSTGSNLADDINGNISTAINMCLLSSGLNNEQNKTSLVSPTVVGVTKNSRASFPLGFGHACRYVGQRVAIVGDAAHRIHPLAGQGVNLGFSDVIELSSQLKKSLLTGADIGDIHALLNYESNAQASNIPIMLGIDMIQKTYGSNNQFIPSALLKFGRNLGLTVCQSATILKRVLSHKASGLPA